MFDGSVYKHMGFTYDGDVKRDYFWSNKRERFRKSRMRKSNNDIPKDITEKEFWESKGYHRIWDYGKKRWLFQL